MSSLLVFNRAYRLVIQSVMLVFSTQLCELLPLVHSPLPPPFSLPSQSLSKVYTDSMWLGVGGEVLSCVGYHILQEFNTLCF
jgi:hypothetical protein